MPSWGIRRGRGAEEGNGVAAATPRRSPAPRGLRGLVGRGRDLAVTMLPGGGIVLGLLTFGVYAAGLLRDKVLTHTFGAGPELDAYFAAFRLPELAFDVLVAGGLVAPFVPLFVGLKGDSAKAAHEFARTVLTLATLVMVVASALLFVFASQSVDFIAPGFKDEQRDLYVGLFRAMLATEVLFAASLVIGEILVAERRFVYYGLAGIMYSGGIAAGTLLLGDQLGIYAAAVGAVGGAAAHFGIRLVGLRGTRIRLWPPSLSLRTQGLGEFVRLMLPKMISQPIEPLSYIYFTGLASALAAGSVTQYTLAQSFQQLPVNMIGMSFAIAAFPALSAAAAAGDRSAFGRVFRRNLVTIGLLSFVAAVGLLVVGGLVIQVIFGGGAFDSGDVSQTTLVLMVFTLSVPIESLMHLFARALYATRNTILPTLAAVAGFATTVVACTGLSGSMGIAAIPAGYAVGMAVRLVLMIAALAVRLPQIDARAIAGQRPAGRGALPRRAVPRPAQALLFVGLLAIAAGTAFATTQAIDVANSSGADPTAWTREHPRTLEPIAEAGVSGDPGDKAGPDSSEGQPSVVDPAVDPTDEPTDVPSAVATASGTPSATPTARPKPFAMDLYQKGDFVGEYTDKWCVPAAMQTSMNIMDEGADTTKATQTKLFNLANSLVPGRYGGAEPEGWAKGLAKLGYGKYEVHADATLQAAVYRAVKQVRRTSRPAGLMVWKGWHSWVVSGFTATADPAFTDRFTVTGLYIEDVWYNRFSTIWGYSDPPDTLVAYKNLGKDYLPWYMGKAYADKNGKYVTVTPVD